MFSQVRAINDRFGIMKSDRNDGKWLDSNKIEKICEKLGEIQISIFNHTGIRQWEIYSLGKRSREEEERGRERGREGRARGVSGKEKIMEEKERGREGERTEGRARAVSVRKKYGGGRKARARD
jgi:hypothetical protein